MADINWKDLAAAIPTNQVKQKKGPGGKTMSFITARTVMNRLDTVCGPENWRDEYTPVPGGMACTLYIRVGGEWVGKTDAAEAADIEPLKSMFSDSLKRAAVRWGIGRELYREGTATYDDDEDDPGPQRTQQSGQPQKSEPEAPKAGATPEEPPRRVETDTTTPTLHWTVDTRALGKMIDWARNTLWVSEKLDITHARNRIACALGVQDWDHMHDYKGTKDEAIKLCQMYEIGSHQPAMLGDPTLAGQSALDDSFPRCKVCQQPATQYGLTGRFCDEHAPEGSEVIQGGGSTTLKATG